MHGCTVNYRNEFLRWVQILLVSATFPHSCQAMHPATHSIPWIEKNGPPGTAGSADPTIAEVPRPKSLQLGKGDCLKIKVPHSIHWFINVNHHCPNIKIAIWGYTPFLDNRDMKWSDTTRMVFHWVWSLMRHDELTHAGYDHPLPRCSQSRTNVVWKIAFHSSKCHGFSHHFPIKIARNPDIHPPFLGQTQLQLSYYFSESFDFPSGNQT